MSPSKDDIQRNDELKKEIEKIIIKSRAQKKSLEKILKELNRSNNKSV